MVESYLSIGVLTFVVFFELATLNGTPPFFIVAVPVDGFFDALVPIHFGLPSEVMEFTRVN